MRAVVVTRNPESLTDVRLAWATDGIETDVVTGVENACRDLPRDTADLVVLDDTLPRSDALRLYSSVRTRENADSLPIIYRCPAIVPPAWAVRDYYVPPAADPGALITLGQEVLGPDLHMDGRSNGHGTSPHLPGPARGGNGTARSAGATEVAPAPAAVPPRTKTWRGHVRAARGRHGLTRSLLNGRAEVGVSTVVPVAVHGRRRLGAATDFALLPFLLRWSWVLVIATAIGLAGSYTYLQSGRLPYESTTLLMLRPNYDYGGEALVSSNPARLAASTQALAGQADAPSVYEATSRALTGQLEISNDEVGQLVAGGRIAITPVRTSSFIQIKASDQDPERAWLLADGYARGFLADLTAQTRLVAAEQQQELQLRLGILQKQLAAIPSPTGNARLAGVSDPAQNRILQDIIDTQTKLQALAQPQLPIMRYGETSAPVQVTNVRRVLIAGAAAGGLGGLVIAYLLELVRQRLRKRAHRGAPPCR